MYAITATAVRKHLSKCSHCSSLRLGRQLPSAAFSHIQLTSRAPRASREKEHMWLLLQVLGQSSTRAVHIYTGIRADGRTDRQTHVHMQTYTYIHTYIYIYSTYTCIQTGMTERPTDRKTETHTHTIHYTLQYITLHYVTALHHTKLHTHIRYIT